MKSEINGPILGLFITLLCFRIANFVVFCITAATSVLAYVWLVIVLTLSSPGKIEIWEAVLTFLFFPILVCVAYAGDKGYLDALFCQKDASKLTNKQQQLELGNVQSGESKYIVPGSDQTSPPRSPLSRVVKVNVFSLGLGTNKPFHLNSFIINNNKTCIKSVLQNFSSN